MCSATALSDIEAGTIDRATVGVLGLTAKDGTPRAVAVTPYVIDAKPVVTTTLAFLAKAKMLRKRPTAALYAEGIHISGDVTVEMHRYSAWFDQHIRTAEAVKYPPAKSLLGFPFHRRVLWWYVGRVSMTFQAPQITNNQGNDRVTITSLVDGKVQVTPLPSNLEIGSDEIEIGVDLSPGPACLLIHEETQGMNELLSLTLLGNVVNGRLNVRERRGSLVPTEPSTIDQLKMLRALANSAKANRPEIDRWETGD